MSTKIPNQYDFYIGKKNLTKLYDILLSEETKMNIVKTLINKIKLPNVRHLYTFSQTGSVLIPIPVKKPDFTPARLSSEDKAKYHARIKQQKMYLRAMKNGGAYYVSN